MAQPNTAQFQDLSDQLEKFVDAYSVRAVLEALAGVCDAKAEHVAHNWQDATTAKAWSKTANKVNRCSDVPV